MPCNIFNNKQVKKIKTLTLERQSLSLYLLLLQILFLFYFYAVLFLINQHAINQVKLSLRISQKSINNILLFLLELLQMSSSENTNNSGELRVTSLRPQCLQKLRNPSQAKGCSTHLLAYMSEFLQEKQEKQTEQVEEYCCFDRIKKILQKNKKLQNYNNRSSMEEEENSKITKVIQLEAKMKKMENALERYTKPIQSTQASPQINRREVDLMGLNKPKTHNFNKRLMINKLKEQAYQKYTQNQKQKINYHQQNIKDLIGEEIGQKVKKMIEDRDILFNQVSQSNKKLEQKILEKDLQIQTLKSKIQEFGKKIQDLQIYRELVQQSEENKKKQNENMKLAKQFQYTFPNMTVMQVQREIQNLNDKCLNKFYDIECKNWEKWNQEKFEFLKEIARLENIILRLKTTQNQLLETISGIRYEHSLATLEVDSLIKDKNELESLQKKILSLYNDWYGSRSESEKSLMKNLGYLRQNYGYEQMLNYIVVFRQKLSTNDKVNDYLIKVLRGIQRIRKILFPKQNNEKLDPIDLLEKLESYIKSKVYQKLYKKGANQKNRSSQKLREELIFLQEQKKQNMIPKLTTPHPTLH